MKKLEFVTAVVALVAAIAGLITSISSMTISKDTQENLATTNTEISSFKEKTNADISKLRKILAEPAHATPPLVTQDKKVIMHTNREKIYFDSPVAFTCGANLTWSDLEDWKSFEDRRICSDSSVYSVTGRIVAYEGTTLSAEIYVPEIAKWFPASGGGIITPNGDGSFSTNFCIQSKGPSRIFRFRLIHNGQLVGNECRINVEHM